MHVSPYKHIVRDRGKRIGEMREKRKRERERKERETERGGGEKRDWRTDRQTDRWDDI